MSEERTKMLVSAVETMQEQAAALMSSVDEAIKGVRALERRLLTLIEEQANDARIWASAKSRHDQFENRGCSCLDDDVEYLQKALRRMHAAVEGEDVGWLRKDGPAMRWTPCTCPACRSSKAAYSVTPHGIEVVACGACALEGSAPLFILKDGRSTNPGK